jgi:hypothetical protein
MEERAMADKKCTGDHTKHICALAEEKKFEAIKQMILNPKYICANCGRAADSDGNLCNPVHINQLGFM